MINRSIKNKIKIKSFNMNRSNNLQFLQVANRERYACLSYTYNFVSNYVLKNINLKGKFIAQIRYYD